MQQDGLVTEFDQRLRDAEGQGSQPSAVAPHQDQRLHLGLSGKKENSAWRGPRLPHPDPLSANAKPACAPRFAPAVSPRPVQPSLPAAGFQRPGPSRRLPPEEQVAEQPPRVPPRALTRGARLRPTPRLLPAGGSQNERPRHFSPPHPAPLPVRTL